MCPLGSRCVASAAPPTFAGGALPTQQRDCPARPPPRAPAPCLQRRWRQAAVLAQEASVVALQAQVQQVWLVVPRGGVAPAAGGQGGWRVVRVRSQALFQREGECWAGGSCEGRKSFKRKSTHTHTRAPDHSILVVGDHATAEVDGIAMLVCARAHTRGAAECREVTEQAETGWWSCLCNRRRRQGGPGGCTTGREQHALQQRLVCRARHAPEAASGLVRSRQRTEHSAQRAVHSTQRAVLSACGSWHPPVMHLTRCRSGTSLCASGVHAVLQDGAGGARGRGTGSGGIGACDGAPSLQPHAGC